MKQYFVYILSTHKHGTLYIGVTNDLIRRVLEHKEKISPKSFTTRYSVDKLVYYEIAEDINEAIWREKQLKSGSRNKKIELIKNFNPEWKDLYNEL
jgi:putative endonuclease